MTSFIFPSFAFSPPSSRFPLLPFSLFPLSFSVHPFCNLFFFCLFSLSSFHIFSHIVFLHSFFIPFFRPWSLSFLCTLFAIIIFDLRIVSSFPAHPYPLLTVFHLSSPSFILFSLPLPRSASFRSFPREVYMRHSWHSLALTRTVTGDSYRELQATLLPSLPLPSLFSGADY